MKKQVFDFWLMQQIKRIIKECFWSIHRNDIESSFLNEY